mgnify:CR=1 FL=1
MRYLKSYLPAHSILRGFVALHLCDFADAIRAGCAEAKNGDSDKQRVSKMMQSVRDVLRQRLTGSVGSSYAFDAIRAGCAEAKCGMVLCTLSVLAMQSVRDVPKRTEGHCIQTIMRRTMK